MKTNFQQEVNKACAEYMGFHVFKHLNDFHYKDAAVCIKKEITNSKDLDSFIKDNAKNIFYFAPTINANDRDLVIEKMFIAAEPDDFNDEWYCHYIYPDQDKKQFKKFITTHHKSRTTAVLKCICSVLDIEWTPTKE